ncbi:GDCCVxC domain-containing (seleno)protein [Pseudomonas sp. BN411]|uniref:GDCCVxC domain-containing (seleno)protein n=1 Tax=Pseudomonas sp. BN411 TaxID=2567887 RepID=UPI002458DDA9|nr:GDCCVxC domain-containing (seleno)protein [Pseudomonas sp. BN411]MDH4559552.1 hypothetical protein [Pseudomonas sp. BN411]
MDALTLDCDLRCPYCGFIARVRMRTDACEYFHECSRCHALLRPKPGDCCVFCSYGSVRCPSRQLQPVHHQGEV